MLGAKSMSFSAMPKLYNALNEYCKECGCTRSWFITQAVEQYLRECLEDKADYEAGIEALKEFEKSGGKTYSSEEVRRELGL